MKCYLADDADEFHLLLSSSQELSFKCWVNLVIFCWLLISAAQLTRILIRLLLMGSVGRYSGREGW